MSEPAIELEHIIRVHSVDGTLQIDRDPSSGAVRIGAMDERSRIFFGSSELILYSTEPNSRSFALAVSDAIREMAHTLPE